MARESLLLCGDRARLCYPGVPANQETQTGNISTSFSVYEIERANGHEIEAG
jgi:hypothetical protein